MSDEETRMTLNELTASLGAAQPPAGLSPVLQALWHDGRGDWEAAHAIAQVVPDPDGAWVHAYLHRKEGDASNAAYWYRRAGRPVSRRPLQEEWNELVSFFLQQ